MKKIYFILISIFVLTIFSCASNNINNDDLNSKNNSKILKAPEDFEEPLVRDLDLDGNIVENNLINDENNNINTLQNTQTEQNNENISNNENKELENKNTNNSNTENKSLNKKEEIKKQTESTKNQIKENNNNQNTFPKDSLNENTKKTDNNTEVKKDNISQNKTKSVESKPKAENQNSNKSKDYSSNNNKVQQNNINNKQKEQKQENTNQKEQSDKNDSFFVIPKEAEKEIKEIETKQKNDTTPSRSVKINKNETLSVTYPGTGWIYLGSTSEYNNLSTTSKQNINNETVYTLVAKEPGKQIHHFYKHDKLTGKFIDDYLEVEVLEDNGSVYTIIKAPEYKDLIPKRPETPAKASKKINPETQNDEEYLNNENLSKTEGTTEFLNPLEIKNNEIIPNEKRDFIEYTPDEINEIQNIENEKQKDNVDYSYTELTDASEILTLVQNQLDEKKYDEAEKNLIHFFEISTEKRDLGLYLQGKLYEQDSSLKDIKKSINSYQNLIDNYPESIYYDKANKRIIYLKRFYIDIR